MDESKTRIPSKLVIKNASKTASSASSVCSDDEYNTAQIGRNVPTAPATINREEYLICQKELLYDRSVLQIKNNLLHRRLAEYYKKRKLEHVLKPLEVTQEVEEKYQQKLFSYEELKDKSDKEITEIHSKVAIVEEKYNGRLKVAQTKFEDLQNLERTTGSGLIFSKKGKPIPDKTVERYLTLQKRKNEQASALCLRYIRARNAVAELDAAVKKLETLGPGLYVYQYEQLEVDKQNYMTKLEEREDELIKHRSKCQEHNQMLAHIREKMNHIDEVIDFTECDLGDAEIEFTRAREELGVVKTRRNKLRWCLEDERLKAGLLTRKDLLRDFQDAVDKVETLRAKKALLEKQLASFAYQLKMARKLEKQRRDAETFMFVG